MVTGDDAGHVAGDPAGDADAMVAAWLEYTSATRELVDAALTVATHHAQSTLTRDHLDQLVAVDRRRVLAGLHYMSV